jgi:hypothetical protein
MQKVRFSMRFMLLAITAMCIALGITFTTFELTFMFLYASLITALALSLAGALTLQGEARAFCIGFFIIGIVNYCSAFTNLLGPVSLAEYAFHELTPFFGVQNSSYYHGRVDLLRMLQGSAPGHPLHRYVHFMIGSLSLSTLALATGGGCLIVFLRRKNLAGAGQLPTGQTEVSQPQSIAPPQPHIQPVGAILPLVTGLR